MHSPQADENPRSGDGPPRTGSRTSDSAPIERVTTATGDQAWRVGGYENVRALLHSTDLGRSHPTPHTAARLSESVIFGSPVGTFDTEPADHLRMRSVLTPLFCPSNMRDLEPRVRSITGHLIDSMIDRSDGADLHAALAVPLPLLVISEFLGVPADERGTLRSLAQGLFDAHDRTRSQHAASQWLEYCYSLIQRKRRQPDDRVFSQLCSDAALSDEHIASLGLVLMLAGHETTIIAIDLSILRLLRDPPEWQQLLDDPKLVPGAVEELLREQSPPTLARYARTDLQICGTHVPQGDLVLLDIDSANHDPTIFRNPEVLDVTRSAGRHLTFGYGLHYCIGAQLARIELRTVLDELIRRLPTLHLAVDPDSIAMRHDVVTRGLSSLPVAW